MVSKFIYAIITLKPRKIVLYIFNTLSNGLSNGDCIPSNVVYKINCQDCDASYVGQTKRILNTRISEYRNHIRRNFP